MSDTEPKQQEGSKGDPNNNRTDKARYVLYQAKMRKAPTSPLITSDQLKLPFVAEQKQLQIPLFNADPTMPGAQFTVQSAWADVIAAEQTAALHVREATQIVGSTETYLKDAARESQRYLDAVTKANTLWDRFSTEGTMLAFVNPQFDAFYLSPPKNSALEEWAKLNGELYQRIAEELRRERRVLEQLYREYQQSRDVVEVSRLIGEFRAVTAHADKVHKRLCTVERLSATASTAPPEWVDVGLAELAIEHGKVDDALSAVGQTRLEKLNGTTPLLLRTWHRLTVFSQALKRIDRELALIFDEILQ